MLDSVTNQPSSISIGGRKFNNLRFADNIDLIAGSESELQTITDALEITSTAYGMENSCQWRRSNTNDLYVR